LHADTVHLAETVVDIQGCTCAGRPRPGPAARPLPVESCRGPQDGRADPSETARVLDPGRPVHEDAQLLGRLPRLGRLLSRCRPALGECVGRRRRNLDLLRRELQVIEVAVEVTGKRYPKPKASRRTVPLPDLVIQALAAFPAGLDELVFRNQRGGPLLRANFRRRVWLPALARLGLVERPTFHDLRHCYAAWLVSEGVPVNVVQAVMGPSRRARP
jgi:integrase